MHAYTWVMSVGSHGGQRHWLPLELELLSNQMERLGKEEHTVSTECSQWLSHHSSLCAVSQQGGLL